MSSSEVAHIGWFSAVWVHAGRLLTRWLRSPADILSTLGMPVMMMVILNVMFSGMVEQFSGAPMDMTGVCVMIAVAQSFTAALMGAGSIVQERHEGLPDRLATLPGKQSTAMAGRILAESTKSFASMLAALGTGFAYGADFGTVAGLLGALTVLAIVAVAAGAVGVMLGFVVDTPQGAVSFAPLVMAAMFFNTAMMPRDMYAEVLRPIVDLSPVTAVTGLVDSLVAGSSMADHVFSFATWFGGLIVFSVVVLTRKAIGYRR
ncbi:MAG: ABC transporter permease [Propionibacteriaceae bacterium]|nr:ABC transporter permease [Propionibacteriaceae bacterium]